MRETEEEVDFVKFYRAYWPRLVAALDLALPLEEEPEDFEGRMTFGAAASDSLRGATLDALSRISVQPLP